MDNLNHNLFKMFINDLPDYLHFATDPDFLNSNPIKYLMIIILLSSIAQGLQQYYINTSKNQDNNL